MKVDYRTPCGKGMVVTDHHDVYGFVKNAARGGATVVLHGPHMVVSTVPCSSHEDTLAYAGLEEAYFDPYGDDGPEGRTLRMGMGADGLTCELWCRDGDDPADGFPFDPGCMERLYRYIVSHPRIARLAGRPDFDIDVAVYDGVQELRWRWDGDGLREVAAPAVPAGGTERPGP